MWKRHYALNKLIILLFLATSLAAQPSLSNAPGWAIDNLPRGAHVPNQLIVHYDVPVSKAQVQDWIKTPVDKEPPLCDEWKTGFRFTVTTLSVEQDFLITFHDGFPCGTDICGAIDPNGTIHARTRGNGLWPNYLIGTGVSPNGPNCNPLDVPPGNIDAIDPIDFPSIPGDIEDIEGNDGNNLPDYDALWHCPPGYNMGVTHGDKRILIALLDSGIDPTYHPELFADQPSSVGRDVFGHGTAVAGIILHQAYNQGKNSSVAIMSQPVLEDDGIGTLARLVETLGGPAIKDHYDIVHMSLGFKPLACDVSDRTAISHHLAAIDQMGTFIVSSAGNYGEDLGMAPQYPAAELGLNYGITVGSLGCGSNPERSYFSSYGSPEVDYLAPGIDILVPNAADNLFRCAEGTSFSAPLVTGMIAGYLSQGNTPSEVLCLLRSGAVPHDGTDTQYGWAAAVNATTNCSADDDDDAGGDVGDRPSGKQYAADSPSKLRVFPNPVRNLLRVQLPADWKEGPGTLEILDNRGTLVLTPTKLATSQDVDVSSLPPGLYFARYRVAGQFSIQRFLKH
ncbi:MAG: S8 family serine peptidase [Bacteroidota bacterium]